MKLIKLITVAAFAVISMVSCKPTITCTCTTAPVTTVFQKPTVTTVTTISEASNRTDATNWCAGLQKANPGLSCSIN